ncbi:MAG: Fic family protein, partial [Proteobacteria bacterium]|nr:Fic family protein [Pseudomonadota bacterium]
IGRLLIPLLLYSRKELSHPMLYLSSFFETNYEKYIETMYEISRIGAWEAWVEFFLEGIEVTCRDAIKKARALQDLHGQYRERVQETRSSALLAKLIDDLFNAPATTIPYAMKTLEISYNSAKANIQRLEELGIITEQPRSRHPKWFFATEIIEAVSESASKSG